MTYTVIIIAITAIISIAGFNNSAIIDKLILWPKKMDNPAEYYRLLTSGFIHSDWNHLFFNMFALYMFGNNVEQTIIGEKFVILYLTGIIIASLPTFLKNRHNSYYRSLGASGAKTQCKTQSRRSLGNGKGPSEMARLIRINSRAGCGSAATARSARVP